MKININARLQKMILPLISLAIGLGAALLLAVFLGESASNVLGILLRGAFGSSTQIGYSLYYATPLILTGLSVAWAFRAGLFNIGGEGQMTVGGVALAAVGIGFSDLPSVVALPLALAACFVSAGLWGALAGWLKAKRGCHEVLATILLNFIAYGLTSYLMLSILKNPDSQNPETKPLGAGYLLSSLTSIGGSSPLSTAIFISLLAVAMYAFIFAKTRFGFLQRMAGGAAEVGKRAGINMDRQVIWAMFISGGLSGLAAVGPILGFAGKAREGFAAGAGFVGIAVALLGRNSAIGVLLAALLFGVLTKGALDLDLDTDKVTRDLAVVIQAFIVLAVASDKGWRDLYLWAKGIFAKGRRA
jgi:ABC-type uncharacterized transport system permease subunit